MTHVSAYYIFTRWSWNVNKQRNCVLCVCSVSPIETIKNHQYCFNTTKIYCNICLCPYIHYRYARILYTIYFMQIVKPSCCLCVTALYFISLSQAIFCAFVFKVMGESWLVYSVQRVGYMSFYTLQWNSSEMWGERRLILPLEQKATV